MIRKRNINKLENIKPKRTSSILKRAINITSISKLKRILKNKKGDGMILACVIALVIIIIICGISEYMRLQIIVKGVRDAMEDSITQIATSNYDETYHGLREGYSGGYYLDGAEQWQGKIDTGDIYSQLSKLLALKKEGGFYVKASGTQYEYKLSNLQVDVINPGLTPSGEDNQLYAEADALLEVPLSFGFDKLSPLKIDLKVKAGFTKKF